MPEARQKNISRLNHSQELLVSLINLQCGHILQPPAQFVSQEDERLVQSLQDQDQVKVQLNLEEQLDRFKN